MRALRKTGPLPEDIHLCLDTEPVELPRSGHVRLRVAACGICGTDLHIMDGSYESRPPVTMGHEVAGTVIERSADVDAAWLGAEVAMETFFSVCGQCQFCRDGRPNMCAARVSIGSGADGGFAQSIVVPAQNLHRLPSRISVAHGALCEPLACVCQSLYDRGPAVATGDRVLVIGPGAVGLLAAQVARSAGGEVTIAGTDQDEHRLLVARRLGFSTLVTSCEQAALPDDWDTEADVVVECSGSGAGMASGLDLVQRRGRYVQIGQTGRPVEVPLAAVSFKELVITGGFASTPASWRRAMTLLGRGVIAFDALITDVMPLEQWREAFDGTSRGAGLKYLLTPNGVTDGGKL